MAEASLLIYPQDENFMPEQEAIESAIELLNQAGDFDWVRYESWDTPHFISAGDALEQVTCPECETEICAHEDEFDEWWHDTINTLAVSELGKELPLNMPCCEAELKARDLAFGDEANFVRFVLKLSEPLDEVEISAQQFAELEQILKCKLAQMIEICA